MLAMNISSALETITTALREADAATARAVLTIADCGGLEASTGLTTELALMLEARMTGSDARMLTQAAATLRAMPATARAFEAGDLSWGQARAILSAVKHVDAQGRNHIDHLVEREAPAMLNADPDALVSKVDDVVSALRADLLVAREDRAIESSFLSIQPRLGGGGSFYGEADTESFATMLEAVDAAAEDPTEAESRARQRLDALVSICEQSLSGGGHSRPRPRLIATIDISSFPNESGSGAARVLHAMAGRLGRLTPLSTDVLVCDAEVVPVIFEGARPVAVGDSLAPITGKMRTALVARDRGCRFPGCRAPVAWCDAHHVTSRFDGGETESNNLILLCRRHHRLVHRHRWRITLHDDGTAEFARRGRRFVSPALRARE